MAKKIVAYVKLVIQGESATPAPPVGSALGPKGVNIMSFCKGFNEKTRGQKDKQFRVEMYVYEDKTFDFFVKEPSVSYLIKKAVNLKSGAKKPGLELVANIKKSQIEEIAKQKLEEFNTQDLSSASNMIVGTARSMGIKVIEG